MVIKKQSDNAVSSLPGGCRRGRLFIVSAPSGAGKTTLCRALLDRFPDMVRSVSYTTRDPRPGERDGVDYYFIGEAEFSTGIENGRWLEWAKVHEHYYGTAAASIKKNLSAGIDMVLNIDVQGADQIHARYPDCVRIFIIPPSMEELKRRLEHRGGDNKTAVAIRMAAAEREMSRRHDYHHVLINDDLARTAEELIAIVAGYRL